MTFQLRCYDYVNHPYESVRAELLTSPHAIFQRATSLSATPELHIQLGAIDLSTEIDLDVLAITDHRREALERPSTTLEIVWCAARYPKLFPIMRASLVLYPLSPNETQLELVGSYTPPLGAVGEVIDAAVLRRYGETAVAGFVREVAAYLSSELSRQAAALAG
jgi:hypothetical protein